jgi:hypothetical protein
VILVKCTHCDKIHDDPKPCILLTTELVRPKTEFHDGEEIAWVSVMFTDKLLPNCPGPEKKLGLVPYPHGTAPVVIADKHGVGGLWGGPFFFFFDIYDMQTDVDDCVGKIFSVEVLEE